MKLSTKGRYAVMAMVDLAKASGSHGGGPIVLADIAERQEISLSYLEQLFSKLRKAGVVLSTRGPGGGYRLARPAGELRIADIMAVPRLRPSPRGGRRAGPRDPLSRRHRQGLLERRQPLCDP